MSATLHDIAKALSLSVSTVSRCLSDHPDSNDATRELVLNTAQQIGYRRGSRGRPAMRPVPPQAVVNQVKAPPVAHVGVFLRWNAQDDRSAHTVTSRILAGMSRQARRMNAALSMHYLDDKECEHFLEPEHQPVELASGMVKASVIFTKFPAEAVRWLSERMPCVTIADRVPGVRTDHVDHDNALSMMQVVEHLASYGHKRIGFISDPVPRTVYLDRYAGLVLAALKHGLISDSRDAVNVQNEGLDRDQVVDFVAQGYARGVTGWVCANDFIGYSLMDKLQNRGLAVPEKISFVGFDCLTPPRETMPRMTSIDSPFEDMGAAAIRQALTHLQRPELEYSVNLFTGQLKVGQSVAARVP